MIVRESLDFERGKDPKEAMGIGRVVNILGKEPDTEYRALILHSFENSPEIESRNPNSMPIGSMVFRAEVKDGKRKGEKFIVRKFDEPFGKYWGLEWDLKLGESLDFERGMDPKKAMGIGISTWGDLKPGDVLKAKVGMGIEGSGRLNNNSNYDRIPYGWYILVDHIKKHPDGKAISIDYYWDDKVPISKNHLTRRIWGTIRQFKNRFDFVQPKDLREDLNFERGMDPKQTMGIGVKKKIRQGIVGLLKTSRTSSTKISTINLLKNREDLWLEISDYGTKDFEDVFYSFLSPEYFKDDIYVKAKPRKFSKSWKNDWKVFIKDEYKEFFKDCFNQEGFIKESLNFERGGDPLDRMDIGRVKERKLKIIDEITKYEPDPWQGSSVLAKYLTRRGKFPIGWDVPMLEDDSMENLKYALEYLRKWEQVEKKQAEQRQRNFIDSKKSNESLDFERGQDPKKAMEIGWGDMLIRNIQEDEEGYTYNVNNKEIEKILRKNIPSINDNEVSRFFNSTLEEILDHISVIDLGKKDYKHISDFIKREIESNSRWWMDLHSDAAMRQIARNSGMKI